MNKYPIYKQDNNYSCGAYCLKMVLKYYHLDVSIKEIKESCKITNDGISVYGMLKCLESFHIDAKAYQCDFDTLLNEAKLPCIIHIINDDLTHYVVLYKVKKQILLGDPAKGLVKVGYEELKNKYTGICICINHVGRYELDNNKKEISFKDFVLRHLKDNYRVILNLVIKALFISICSIISSYYFQGLIDKVSSMDEMMILLFTMFFVVISGIKGLINFQRKELEIKTNQQLNQNYVNKTVSNMLYLPFSYFYRNSSGVLISKVMNLFMLSDFFIHMYMAIFMDLILVIGLFLAILCFSLGLGLIVLVFLLIISGYVFIKLKDINKLNKIIISSQEMMNQGYLEYLKNIYNTHQFFVKKFAKDKISFLFEDYNYYLCSRNQAINKLSVISEQLVQLMSYITVLFACMLYKQKIISVGEIILLYMLIAYMIEPLFNIINFIIEKDEIKVLYQRYLELIPNFKNKQLYLKGSINMIKFDHISYSYGYHNMIIDGLDLLVDHSICLKGDTGAGKTTLLKLLMKQDDLLKGDIYINDVNLKDIDTNSLYRKVIYLDKEPLFYNESLIFNLLLNLKCEEEMVKLLMAFDMNMFIDKLEMVIEDNGKPLSSGQRQVMMLIRALLHKPEVLILDEALCNIDESKLLKIFNYIKDNYPKIIMIIVAHQTKLVYELFDCVIIRSGKIDK